TEAGVTQIVVPATEADNFARVLALAEKYDELYAALGLHPIAIERHSAESLERLEACLAKRDAKLVAVGEIGLDLYREDPQFARQVSVFEA
ncbi:TatD family hydrolase, partial [Escherichia coli]